jgi:CubicO group peptidase (beta-lactamase class C family)
VIGRRPLLPGSAIAALRGADACAQGRGDPKGASGPAPLSDLHLERLRAAGGAPALAAAALNVATSFSVSAAQGLRAADSSERVTIDDKWHLGSITKSMTATLAAQCVEAGAVAWDDTVGGVLGAAIPDMRAEYRDATFRHLLSHRAGLQANIGMADLLRFPRESADSRADRIAYARAGLRQAPRGPREQTFEYSNTGYVIAGAMLEAKLGVPWEVLIQERLFQRFGMMSAGFGAPGAPGAYDQPVGHAPGLLGRLRPHPPGDALTDNVAALGPAGRVHAKLDDVLHYLRCHCDRVLMLERAESWAMLHTPPFGGDYAMGWVKRPDGALWHNGSNTLWYAEILFDPARDLVAAAACNDGRADQMSHPVGAALLSAMETVSAPLN